MKGLFSITLVLGVSTMVECLSKSDMEKIKATLKEDHLVGPTNVGAPAVRLGFHDCVGGCDGCLNLNNKDNAGLANLTQELEEVYADPDLGYNKLLSRADFWALAATYSVELAIEHNNKMCKLSPKKFGLTSYESCKIDIPTWTFKTGRKDCATSPKTTKDVHLPGATLDYTSMIDFFKTEFGFSPREMTALMGAHALGSAFPENSGFKGTWTVVDENALNNQYYRFLIKEKLGSSKMYLLLLQQRDTGNGITSDVVLYKALKVDSSGHTTCLS